MNPIDIGVIIVYAIFIFGLAQWVSRDKKGAGPKTTTDYFLASKALPLRYIGNSLPRPYRPQKSALLVPATLERSTNVRPARCRRCGALPQLRGSADRRILRAVRTAP